MMDDELVRYRAGKAPVPAFAVEPKQVVAIGVGFVDPQFADHAAIGQRLVHLGSPQRQSPAWSHFLGMLRSESYVGTYMVQCSKNPA
jgi:hypothetical protein